jgi:hypothetical protein
MSGSREIKQLARELPSALYRRGFSDPMYQWSLRRYVRREARAATFVLERYGAVIGGGPFAGMSYLSDPARDVGLAAKLLGVYERELHEAINAFCERDWERIVNVGCAAGYYLIGLALRCPSTPVWGFDIDVTMQESARELASMNGVLDRTSVAGECSTDDLIQLAGERVLLLIDCEGCEAGLLDPAAATLATSTILVECHDFIVPRVSSTILRRFSASHQPRVIHAEKPDWRRTPEVAGLPTGIRRWGIDINRPPGMRWLVLEPLK